MKIVILGIPEHEGRICGNTFDLLGIEPTYFYPNYQTSIISLKPDVILLTREWEPPIRLAANQARHLDIPVVYIMDGVIEWSYIWNNQSYVLPQGGTVLQPLIASNLCVTGRHPARILSALGLADRIHIIGLPRLDRLERIKYLASDQKPKILITTAKTYGHNLEQKLMVKKALYDLRDFFEANSFIEPIWRISKEIAEEIKVNPQLDGEIIDTLRNVSGLISFTSTSLLEGMLLGIPTAQVEYRAIPIYVQTAWEIRCVEHIQSVIQELLYPPSNKIAYQDYCLEDELEPGSASERLAEIIKKLANKKSSKDNTYIQPINQFGKLDYRKVHSQLSFFSISSNSILQYELDSMVKAKCELQELLKSQEALLKSQEAAINNKKVEAGVILELIQNSLMFKLIIKFKKIYGFRKIARSIKQIVYFLNNFKFM